jgi:hypothetical protein
MADFDGNVPTASRIGGTAQGYQVDGNLHGSGTTSSTIYKMRGVDIFGIWHDWDSPGAPDPLGTLISAITLAHPGFVVT